MTPCCSATLTAIRLTQRLRRGLERLCAEYRDARSDVHALRASQCRLGHRVYAHLFKKDDSKAAEAINATFNR
jgi:hypothetical protein